VECRLGRAARDARTIGAGRAADVPAPCVAASVASADSIGDDCPSLAHGSGDCVAGLCTLRCDAGHKFEAGACIATAATPALAKRNSGKVQCLPITGALPLPSFTDLADGSSLIVSGQCKYSCDKAGATASCGPKQCQCINFQARPPPTPRR